MRASQFLYILYLHWRDYGQAIVSQVVLDDKLRGLVEAMSDMFAFVNAAEPLKVIDSHAKIIKCITLQVTDCGYFISQYAKDESFCEVVCSSSGLLLKFSRFYSETNRSKYDFNCGQPNR